MRQLRNFTLKSESLLTYFLIVFISSVITIDALGLIFPNIGFAGTIMQIASICLLAIYALYAFTRLLKSSGKKKSFFTILVLAIWLVCIGYWAQDSRSLSGETTQETACALKHFENSPDKGLHQTCLFGYPARQYLPQVLSSLAFSRSLVALNIGGSIYFVIGLMLFAQGLREYFAKNEKADVITGIFLSLLFHYRFVNHFLFQFEQSIFPLSFALMLVGLGMQFLNKPKYSHIAFASLVIVLAAHSYTPSLVILALCILFVVIYIIKKRVLTAPLVWLLVVACLSIVLSLTYRSDITITAAGERSIKEISQDVLQAHNQLLLGNQGEPYSSPLIHGVFLFLGISMLTGFHGKKVALISWWSYGVIVLAIVSKGYSYYAVDFRLHRSLVILAPLLGCAAFIAKPFLAKIPHKHLVLLFGFSLFSGVYYSYSQFSSRIHHPHYEVIQNLSAYSPTSPRSLLVTKNAADSDNLISLRDTAQYFLPNIVVQNMDNATKNVTNCQELIHSQDLVLLHESENACINTLKPGGKLNKISSAYLESNYYLWIPSKFENPSN